MWRNSRIPGLRWLLYGAGLAGLFRAAEEEIGERHAPARPIDPTTRAEPQDVNATAVLLAGVGTLLTIWVIVVALYPLFSYFKYERTGGRTPEKVLEYLPAPPPLPRNQEQPHRDLVEFRRSEEAALHSYRWVDRAKGIVSIPIGRAMKLVIQNGIPPSTPGASTYYAPRAGSKQTGLDQKVKPEPR